ncbi:gluconate 2-dehydrogenase subunit 3 family protein [Sphingobacterium tabacisoli]|uniref:Gluconate 2-dehydrogenase subunit 3 family protein n=1 Tax=Sphingobacterium tabacisoli TaxID=2044855 RepID=A0ABW5L9K6_9SPHI|nr:gluconate 2-dehydrogenase subunit 3 family protein [Sphingobacterium tabacisoli]
MNRRESLKALGLLASGTGLLAASSCGPEKNKAIDHSDKPLAEKLPGVQDFEHERNQKLQEEQFFSTHEMATITCLVDYIIPKDEFSGSASEAGVPDFIEFIVKDMPHYQIPMRGGVKWMDIRSQKKMGKVFINCTADQQITLLDEIAFPSRSTAEVAPGVNFFKTLRNLTASGFYTSKVGIDDLGYVGNRPGVWSGVPADVLQAHGFKTDEG